MTLNISTSWDIRAAAGEPSATIRVNNLQAITTGPHDAWGRANRPQPISISVEVSMAKPFNSSSAFDVVEADTVHYGLLSKEILNFFDAAKATPDGFSLAGVLEMVWRRLTGFHITDVTKCGPDFGGFLKKSSFRYLRLTLKLPKASLLGSGVSLTGSAFMDGEGSELVPKARAMALKIHDLRVPVLIGVNKNEREAKQVVVANVEVDKWNGLNDEHCTLEAMIVKAMGDSFFETLERLLVVIACKITEHLQSKHPGEAKRGWKLKISLEKPVAVPFADAPCVELSTDTRDIQVG